MYRAYGLLLSGTDFTLEAATTRLTAKFPGYAVTRRGDQITFSKGDWEIEVALVGGPQVQGESEGLSGDLAGLEPAEAAAIAACDRRVEVWSDTPDPSMEHFNEYLFVVEVLKSFRGVVVVDPREPAIL
jgi:hypothetical protein